MTNMRDWIKKASRMDLTTGLVGRTLSRKDRLVASVGFEEREYSLLHTGRLLIRKYNTPEQGEYVIVETVGTTFQSPDASEGWERIHIGHRVKKTTTNKYDSTGKLRERVIDQTAWRTPLSSKRKKTTVTFNPPGRIIGERTISRAS